MELSTFYGIEPTPELARQFRQTRPAAVQLLRRNIESPDQVRALVEGLRRDAGYRLEFAVQHEGGAETPFARGVTFFPGLEALERAASPELSRAVGRVMRRELAEMGISRNWLPGATGPMGRELLRGLAETNGGDDGTAVAAAVAAAAIRVERDPEGLLPISSGARAGLLVPRLGDVAHRQPIADDLRATASLVRPNVGAGVAVLEAAVDPSDESVALALEWAAAQEAVVFFSFDARRHAGQQKLLEKLQERCARLAVVVIGESHDETRVGGRAACVTTLGFQACQIRAAMETIFAGGNPE